MGKKNVQLFTTIIIVSYFIPNCCVEIVSIWYEYLINQFTNVK